MVSFGFKMEGDLNDFDADQQSKLADRLRANAGCSEPQCSVSTSFAGGSVSVDVEFIMKRAADSPLYNVQRYTDRLYPAILSHALQVNVTSLSPIDTYLNVSQRVPSAPPPPPVSEAGIRALLFFAGALTVWVIEACALCWVRRRARVRELALAGAEKYQPETPQPTAEDWRERLKIGTKAVDAEGGDTEAGESQSDAGVTSATATTSSMRVMSVT